MSEKNIFLCIHGHFYQPPRENPWLESIELQESAAPFHDWNERIHHECYLPNAMARVLDKEGNIVNIVNNYESMSFNFGPTLLSWLEEKHPQTYIRILNADRQSRLVHQGHGNAIAQVYNHMIMPLASERDKITQIKWGLEDFQYRFGRAAESIWLPETACNMETLEALIEEGIRFIILDARQAEAIRALGQEHWQDVSSGTVDPKFPYRAFSKKNPKKFIDIFFYDGPIARGIGFGDLAFDAKRFAHHLEMAKISDIHSPQLIHVATDGETYGHHKPFGDRVLAYLLNVEATQHRFEVTNYAAFLDKVTPQFEVRLKEGENGEGTSWSCAHGVKRWKEHCGCRGGGPGEWTQEWRKPLRETLDWLRDELAKVYETCAGSFLKDIWDARNQYISVILDRSEKNVLLFFGRFSRHPLTRDEMGRCLKLLEMQRHAMLMYTSCGWFFTEISGIETVQILQYAARAIQLAEEMSGQSIEEEFLNRLSKAPSNIPELRDGRGVYERFVKPGVASLRHIVSSYAIGSVFEDYYGGKEHLSLYSFQLQVMHQRKESFGNLTLNFGRARVVSKITLEENDLAFIVAQIGLYDFRCSVKPFNELKNFDALEKDLFESLRTLHIVDLLRKIDLAFGEKYFALKDLPLHERIQIISFLTKEVIEKVSVVYENLYDENRRMNEIYRSINLPIPEQIRYAVEHTLRRRLHEAVMQIAVLGFNPKKATPVYRVIEAAKGFDVELRTRNEEVARFLSRELEKRTKHLLRHVREELITECLNIQKLARKIGVELDLRSSQDHLFFLLRQWVHDSQSIPDIVRSSPADIMQLMTDLQINLDEFKKIIHKSASVGSKG